MKQLTGRQRRFGSLRSRLTLLATTLVAAVLLVSAAGLVTAQRSLLVRSVDEALLQRADNIQGDIGRGTFGILLPGEGDREDSFLQLLDSSGRVVAWSANVRSLPAVTPALRPNSPDQLGTASGVALSSHDFRILARPITTAQGSRTLVVAKNLDDVRGSVSILTTSLALTVPIVLALLAALLWWLIGRVLRPVEAIRAEVSSISGSELHRRVPVQSTDDEISRLARTMNAMLDRVEQARDRQRQFVSDASHELRSPLTRIRTELEIGIAHPQATDPDSTYRSLLADAGQLQQLIDDLLFLARSESGVIERPDATVDLDDLVLEQAKHLRGHGKVKVDVGSVSAARVRGDANQLGRAIANLASNAERHAATTVSFELAERDGHSELVVADDGPGIPADQRSAVFQRFTRLDEARSRDEGGAGLGLAIVADIVARHEGSITIESAVAGGARLVVTFPTGNGSAS